MVEFLITAFAVLAIIAIGLYFWQKPAHRNPENVLPPPPNARGLFGEDPSSNTAEKEQQALAAGQFQEALIARARGGELPALNEAHESGNPNLYERVLTELVQHADSDATLHSLMSYVSRHELPTNRGLASAIIHSWQRTPDRSFTAKALHFAALTDDPDLYRDAVESALRLWREQKLADIAALELRALFDGEFWVLSSRSRSSGAGFLLKRTLASARRELEEATRANR